MKEEPLSPGDLVQVNIFRKPVGVALISDVPGDGVFDSGSSTIIGRLMHGNTAVVLEKH